MKEAPEVMPEAEGFPPKEEPTEEEIARQQTLIDIESELRSAIGQGIEADEIAKAIRRGLGTGLKGDLNRYLIITGI